MTLPIARCEDCRWGDFPPNGVDQVYNYCRYPVPLSLEQRAERDRWPKVNPDDWCRQFIHKELGAQFTPFMGTYRGAKIGGDKQWRFPTEAE